MTGMESGYVSIVEDRVGIEPLPTTTGSDAQAQFGRMKARLVARYKLVAVSGRPEELVSPGTNKGVSLGYGCRSIRVREMVGRTWISAHDFQIGADWKVRLAELLDSHFGYQQDTDTK